MLKPTVDPFITYTYDKAGNILAAHATTDLTPPPPRNSRERRERAREEAQRAINHARLESLFQ